MISNIRRVTRTGLRTGLRAFRGLSTAGAPPGASPQANHSLHGRSAPLAGPPSSLSAAATAGHPTSSGASRGLVQQRQQQRRQMSSAQAVDASTFWDDYEEHVSDRKDMGIDPLPLNAEQTAQLCEIVKDPSLEP